MATIGRSREEARGALPEALRDVFDTLVADYLEASQRLVGWSSPSYIILSDLVRQGWRKADPPG